MSNKDWTWEPSPKNEFNRRRLERCYNLHSPPKESYTTLSNKRIIKQLPDDYDPCSRQGSVSPKPPPKKTMMSLLAPFRFFIFVLIGSLVLGAVRTLGHTPVESPQNIEYNDQVPVRDHVVIQ